jgi:dTDP-4-dehydrorhamnose reductase
MKILVLGASGMLGNAIFRFFSDDLRCEVLGSVRSKQSAVLFELHLQKNMHVGLDIHDLDSLTKLFGFFRPNIVINCVGLVKQNLNSNDFLSAIMINSSFPHQLLQICNSTGARLIHVSTDCVFSGAKGGYTEIDVADATDVYGRTKWLGEILSPNAITLRTSIIGHELDGCQSLIEWFLSQQTLVKGYKNAIFSGLPTIELARIIRDYVIPNSELQGIYHVSSEPINKFDLLHLVAVEYGKTIEIIEDGFLKINRSLDSSKFQKATGFITKSWPELLHSMHKFG